MHVNSKSNKSREVKFIIAISKHAEPTPSPLPEMDRPFPINPPSKKVVG